VPFFSVIINVPYKQKEFINQIILTQAGVFLQFFFREDEIQEFTLSIADINPEVFERF